MEESKRIEVIIGENIRALRVGKDNMSQAELGEKLGEILGATWSRSTVSQAESGKRSFVAAELVALSIVFGAGIQHLFRHRSGEAVQVSESYTLPGRRLEALTMSLNDPMVIRAFGSVREHLAEQEKLQKSLVDMTTESRRLTDAAIQAITFVHPRDLKKGKEDA
ncbi:helix-turn-helix domain-containing protein [Arthrobacter sp. ISL-69]|uniref:helix-turn-helix domain-containing protein n=1 Tax=Arthrobacter sp. ISL-69 TaxID=2819113 RepID=UPI001BE5F781|nr:helix-turn-helix transcriptional regulator [Arthrobacter sp. ISL-69]MBT2538779.1 helix-turn-helix transcriptional regulator [Arthrobacter sp. ISL-69]